ncbi:hypothetical protein BLNAU_22306 [Blattamonas nauphoetae]|uniref:Uncharacterized protein n=1 Tax=Blattamonas nauphoetae TaxID=2049346 RepID=A0ABQ9WTE9_9EUKA|nr:hypothetical protein BLNAU_22306 [Blattamonas nauphoetae]
MACGNTKKMMDVQAKPPSRRNVVGKRSEASDWLSVEEKLALPPSSPECCQNTIIRTFGSPLFLLPPCPIVKFQPTLDDALEAKALKFLKSVRIQTQSSADAFLSNFASFADESLTDFTHSIVVLISSSNLVITVAAMKMLDCLIWNSSAKALLALIKADLIPQVINTLNPLSLSFAEAVDFHTDLIHSIDTFVWLATPGGRTKLGLKDVHKQLAVQETVLKQVLGPSEKYIWHFCANHLCESTMTSHYPQKRTRLSRDQ